MKQRIKALFDEAQRLTPPEREELAELLRATIDVDPAIEAAWAKEIDDRIAAHDSGEITTRPVAEVLAAVGVPRST